jgi:predicted nucleotidyltransferase component of viral defense system
MQDLMRMATAEEIRFYEEHVYPMQDVILQTLTMYQENVYLTGGTALGRFYFSIGYRRI